MHYLDEIYTLPEDSTTQQDLANLEHEEDFQTKVVSKPEDSTTQQDLANLEYEEDFQTKVVSKPEGSTTKQDFEDFTTPPNLIILKQHEDFDTTQLDTDSTTINVLQVSTIHQEPVFESIMERKVCTTTDPNSFYIIIMLLICATTSTLNLFCFIQKHCFKSLIHNSNTEIAHE